jgi:hypothetical protein
MVLFLCISDGYVGQGTSLKEAYDDLVMMGYAPEDPEDCRFLEAEEVEVEVKIVKKEVISKINKKVSGVA